MNSRYNNAKNPAAGPWYIVDGIGPFFRYAAPGRVNWSKIPFRDFERGDGWSDPSLAEDFARFCSTAAGYGYNTVTLDDLVHAAPCASHPPERQEKLRRYREIYHRLVAGAEERGLRVLFTSDVMSFPAGGEPACGSDVEAVAGYMAELSQACLREYPTLAGLVFRVGECDGVDARGDFRSRLVLREPRDLRVWLQTLLPVFEAAGRTLILRTWSAGVGRLGDLMWNPRTFDAALGGVESPALVLSMKHGESDFFRFLRLNPLFFCSPHRKIVELQARREYEGSGEFPAFAGWDYEQLRDQLLAAPGWVGIQVWVQTGGWTPFRRLTFLQPEGLWNEINAAVAVALFRNRLSCEGAIRRFYAARWDLGRWDRLLELLRLSDEVIRELLYIDDVARRESYFRRVRVPPLLGVYWDHIVINELTRVLHRRYVLSGESKVREGRAALMKITRMRDLAAALGLPQQDLCFMEDTFRILAAARAFFFLQDNPEHERRLQVLVQEYRRLYPEGYHVVLDTRSRRRARRLVRWLLVSLTRPQGRYRLWVDHVLVIRLMGLLYPLFKILPRRWLPAFARHSAMGLDALFR